MGRTGVGAQHGLLVGAWGHPNCQRAPGMTHTDRKYQPGPDAWSGVARAPPGGQGWTRCTGLPRIETIQVVVSLVAAVKVYRIFHQPPPIAEDSVDGWGAL
jgi:hypothetical protein